MNFDLLIKNGHVIDSTAGYDGRLDVAIRRNRIAAVEANIPAEAAFRVIDAEGQLVTPGLVDLHTHVYHGATFWGVQPDPVAARSGVTTWLDVGSAGAYNAPGLHEYIVKCSQARVYGLLNISAIGLVAPSWEHWNINYLDVDLCCKLVDLNRDWLLGIKVRIDVNTVGANGLEPLKRAREAAERCQMPMMVHIGVAGPLIDDVLALMRPGDILTHCCTGHTMRIIDDQGRLLDSARRAWDAGVIMDIGHGAGSFAFDTAEALLAAGRPPDVISSDIHQMSILGPCFDLPTCMSKLLALGMPLNAVIDAATHRPAQVLGLDHEIGTLHPGALADVALFRLAEGDFTLYDVFMNPRQGKRLLVNTLTIINGRLLDPRPDPPTMPWIDLSEGQQSLLERGHTPQRMARMAG
jgi:dihydroorotase